jgi:hypothetical protein
MLCAVFGNRFEQPSEPGFELFGPDDGPIAGIGLIAQKLFFVAVKDRVRAGVFLVISSCSSMTWDFLI